MKVDHENCSVLVLVVRKEKKKRYSLLKDEPAAKRHLKFSLFTVFKRVKYFLKR